MSFWVPKTRLCLPQVNKYKKHSPKRVKYLETPSSIFFFLLPHPQESSLLSDSETRFVELGEYSQNMLSEAFWTANNYSFDTIRRVLRSIYAKQKFAQLRTNYIRRILPTMFAHLRTGFGLLHFRVGFESCSNRILTVYNE